MQGYELTELTPQELTKLFSLEDTVEAVDERIVEVCRSCDPQANLAMEAVELQVLSLSGTQMCARELISQHAGSIHVYSNLSGFSSMNFAARNESLTLFIESSSWLPRRQNTC